MAIWTNYTSKSTPADNDTLLEYDATGRALKQTPFSGVYNWLQAKIHALTASTGAWAPSTDKLLTDRNGTLSRIDYSVLAKAIVEEYTGSSVAGANQAIKTALDSLNSNSKTIYTGTTSFAEIDPVRQDNQGLGAWIDTKISSVISSFEKYTIHMVNGVNNGPYYGAIFFKANDSYYAGILWSYHQNARNTPWHFIFSNGIYKLRPLAVPIL